MAAETVVQTVGLTKWYRQRAVVDNLTLTVNKGDVYGFVGRNGAGKSTAMKMICGAVLPTGGGVELFGEPQKPGTTSRRMGAMIEGPGIHPELSGYDNVMVRALALGIANPKAAVQDALGCVGLDDAARKRAKTYSLGMKQRLGLALALVGGPDLLLLDEPFNGLDPQGVRDIRTLILQLNETRGVTVFVSSHVLDQLARMVTRYGVIREGKLVCELTAAEVERDCSDYLSIRTPQSARALAVLQEAFPQVTCMVMPDGEIRAAVELAPEDAANVLVGAGIPLAGLGVHGRDIEEFFVELMGIETADAGKGGGRRA